MRDDCHGQDRAGLRAAGGRIALDVTRQESGGELIALAGGVDHLDHRHGGDVGAFAVGALGIKPLSVLGDPKWGAMAGATIGLLRQRGGNDAPTANPLYKYLCGLAPVPASGILGFFYFALCASLYIVTHQLWDWLRMGAPEDPDGEAGSHGGAITLGHPSGCTGSRQTVITPPGLRRTGKELGVISMCIGTGMGAAGVIESEQ